MLRNISVRAFKNDFEKYGSYLPGIKSVEWHLSRIKAGHYYKIEYDNNLAGGICLIPKGEKHMEIKYFYRNGFSKQKLYNSVI